MGKTALVTGAGFTKAFFPEAPLTFDDYGAQDLLVDFQGFPHAHGILKSELDRDPEHRCIDLERLMTRLERGMPYDGQGSEKHERALLLAKLKDALLRRIELAMKGPVHQAELSELARYCVLHNIHYVTFNYDDALDRSQYEQKNLGLSVDGIPQFRSWHPSSGYGFPMAGIIREAAGGNQGQSSNLILKLHGSVNWFPKEGAKQPYEPGLIFHKSRWFDFVAHWDVETIVESLAIDPLIVPPLLVKADLHEEPIIRTVWRRAQEVLENSERIFFIGYSMPLTDIAATYLFTEALSGKRLEQIHVVNKADDVQGRASLMQHFRRFFPRLPDSQFDFRGALDWAKDFAKMDPT